MGEPIVFFSRCRPLGFDVVDIAIKHNRVFIGWGLPRSGADYDPHNLRSCVVDLLCPESEWKDEHAKAGGGRSFSANRNLVNAASIGSIALIPRPARGLIYCGRISHPFELINDPPWADEYLALKSSGHEHDVSDVAQCWQVE
jgi:hypothetical protein